MDYCVFLSAVWTLILTAPIHCRGSIAEQVMQCYISPNLMQKQAHLHLGRPQGEDISSKSSFIGELLLEECCITSASVLEQTPLQLHDSCSRVHHTRRRRRRHLDSGRPLIRCSWRCTESTCSSPAEGHMTYTHCVDWLCEAELMHLRHKQRTDQNHIEILL